MSNSSPSITHINNINININNFNIHKSSSNLLVGIMGNGEIGKSLHQVYKLAKYTDVIIRDPYQGIHNSLSECDIVNVAIPFFGYDKFVTSLKELRLRKGCLVIIQSTIGVGTTDQIQKEMPDLVVIQSPVRGVHPNLTEGMLTFDKYIGISDKYYDNKMIVKTIEDHLVSLNMKPVITRAKESELAKVVSTTLYGINIAAINDVAEMCQKFDVDFDKVFKNGKKDIMKVILN